MPDIIEELKRKRKTIEQFQRDKANQEGQEAQLFKQLQDGCDVETVEDAEEVLIHLYEEKTESEELLEKLDKVLAQIICDAVPGSSSGSV